MGDLNGKFSYFLSDQSVLSLGFFAGLDRLGLSSTSPSEVTDTRDKDEISYGWKNVSFQASFLHQLHRTTHLRVSSFLIRHRFGTDLTSLQTALGEAHNYSYSYGINFNEWGSKIILGTHQKRHTLELVQKCSFTDLRMIIVFH